MIYSAAYACRTIISVSLYSAACNMYIGYVRIIAAAYSCAIFATCIDQATAYIDTAGYSA